MVYKQEDRERKKLMEGSKFSRPFFNVRWGNQKVMKCLNVNSNSIAAPTMMMPTSNRKSELQRGGSTDRFKGCRSLPSPVRVVDRSSDGIEAFKKEVLSDFQSAVDNMKVVFREGLEIPPVKPATPPAAEIDGGAVRQRHLRTRRAGYKEPWVNGVNGGGSGGGNVVDGGRSLNVDVSIKPTPLRKESRASNSSGGGQKRERAKFSCSLSRSEIEQDYFQMTGKRLPRRPHKRPKHVQKTLESLYPAMWLTEVHPDNYKVPDLPDNGKR